MVKSNHSELSIVEQCLLLSISHSGFYYVCAGESTRNLEIMKLIDKIHLECPFYGFRRIRAVLRNYGYNVGKKLIIRLMKLMAIETIYPKPKTTISAPEHKVYPYLLRGLRIDHCNHVWEMDITYIAMKQGFMYLAAVIDVFSRKILSWSISNTMEATWCKEIVANAIAKHGSPKIFNTDQGSQFSSEIFVSCLLENQIQPSMDGRGRATDDIYIERFWRSIKQEKIYLNAYETGAELNAGVKEYIKFYNTERVHQSLDYQTPESVYKKICQQVA
jgi:putative transposase